MRGGQIDRVKRQLLRQAVSDNLDTIRGLPPRSLRPSRRFAHVFLRRAPLVIIPLMLAGFAFLSNTGIPSTSKPIGIAPLAAARHVEASAAPVLMTDTLEPVSASAFPLSVRRVVLDGVYADVRRDESQRLATAVQLQLFSGLRGVDPGLENWGVKRAPFIVLVATEMPAILAEVGCLSNEREAEMLHSGAYRQQIAQALFHGIHAYASANDAPQKKGP